MRDTYLHLGISENATLDEINAAYKVKARLYDPSRFQPDTPEWKEARRMRGIIDMAYSDASSSYVSLHSTQSKDKSKRSGTWLALSLGLLAIAILCLAGVLLFKKNEHKDITTKTANELKEEPRNSAASSNFGVSYADLVERVLPSIVRINTDKATGSGFFASDRGDVLTNYHVIEGAKDIVVVPYKGEPFYALLKDFDADNDMALIVMNDNGKTPFLKISNTLPRQGENVIAIGNPKGLDGTVSNGIISAFRENNTLVQFTAPISPGSSGGALINTQGEVVGMPTMLLQEGQNLNFAIAPGLLRRFFNNARYKTPRTMPKMASRKSEVMQPNNEPDMLFVQKDKSYEIYLETGHIIYDKGSSVVTFITAWYPSEMTKGQIAKDPNFDLI